MGYINWKNLLKIFIKIIIIYYLLSYKNFDTFEPKKIIQIDNKINEIIYENDIDYSNCSTNVNAIAIYFPQFVYIKNNYHFENKEFEDWKIIEKKRPLFKGHHQPRIKDKKYFNLELKNFSITEFIKKQIKLAKNHGLYGFGIIYYWFSGKKLYDEPINIFLKNKEINFPFFLIWYNGEYDLNKNVENESIIIKNNYTFKDAFMFLMDAKKYLMSEKYIKIKKKPILAIYEPFIIINLNKFLSYLRINAKNLGLNEIFILGTIYHEYLNYSKLFDYNFEIPPKNIKLSELYKNDNFFYYTGLIYKININPENKNVYRGIILEWDNTPENKNSIIFNEYSPEKFYLMIKILINSTNIENNKDNNFFFINGWNNWKECSYLEPDDKFGYSSINSLSKALFNLTYREENYNIINLSSICKVAVQAHIFYEDLIMDIINKTNNIPIKYDFFISTTSKEIGNIILKFLSLYSKANQYEIIIVNNKGRDILPLLTQLKYKVKQYKYLCHIHSKKSKKDPFIGSYWRNYLYNNLMGNKGIVSEILSDFENNEKLGFIFPETFYFIKKEKLKLTQKNLKYMKFILKKLFPNSKPGILLDFPAGNMFWARTSAIFQIFEFNFDKKFEKEKDQTNNTIMHAIERIWLYLVKLNNYKYKTIFKSFY